MWLWVVSSYHWNTTASENIPWCTTKNKNESCKAQYTIKDVTENIPLRETKNKNESYKVEYTTKDVNIRIKTLILHKILQMYVIVSCERLPLYVIIMSIWDDLVITLFFLQEIIITFMQIFFLSFSSLFF